MFNYYEAIVVFLLMLNSVIYPNYITSFYFAFSLLLMILMMTRVAKTNKIKFFLSIGMIVSSILILAGKASIVFLFLKTK
jgi:hypothetical protein